MEYRFERGRAARRVLPVLVVLAVPAGLGLGALDRAPSTSASLGAATLAADPGPALVPVAADAPPAAAATAPPEPPPPAPTTPATDPPPPPPPATDPPPPATDPPTGAVTPDTDAVATGATLPAQPSEPIDPPPDPRGEEERIELGTISIPTLGLTAPLLEGIRLTTLDQGPGHWPGTALPGEVGNVVVAAHRVSHGGPFRHIDRLVPGDTVEFTTPAGSSTYVVTGTQIVGPEAIWIVDPTDTPTATLFACHPPGSVSQRIVVNLDLAS